MLYVKSNSIRQKLQNWLLLLLIPSLLLGTISAYYLANHFANLAYNRALFRIALALADEIEVKKNGAVALDLPDSALNLLEYDTDDYIYYQVRDSQNRVLLGDSNLVLPKPLPQLSRHVFYNATFEDKPMSMVALNYLLTDVGGQVNAIIVVGETRTKRSKMAREIIVIMLVPQIILILLIIFLVNLGIERGLVSLENLRALIARRLPTDMHPLEIGDAPEELEPLVHAMNELLIKEKSMVNARRHFLANAAHQLKTPLAGLKVQAEAALREPDLASTQHALRLISRGSDNLGRLANQLLSLARAEPEETKLTFKELNLVALIQEVSTEWVAKALDKNMDLGFQCQLKELKIEGNAILLQELLNNLIDNAIRYNPEGTKITVGLVQVDHVAILSVQDDGLGIPQYEQTKVFERFYRVLGTAENGCGLGLAIVEEIAHRHQARVVLEYADTLKYRGTIVQIYFSMPSQVLKT